MSNVQGCSRVRCWGSSRSQAVQVCQHPALAVSLQGLLKHAQPLARQHSVHATLGQTQAVVSHPPLQHRHQLSIRGASEASAGPGLPALSAAAAALPRTKPAAPSAPWPCSCAATACPGQPPRGLWGRGVTCTALFVVLKCCLLVLPGAGRQGCEEALAGGDFMQSAGKPCSLRTAHLLQQHKGWQTSQRSSSSTAEALQYVSTQIFIPDAHVQPINPEQQLQYLNTTKRS